MLILSLNLACWTVNWLLPMKCSLLTHQDSGNWRIMSREGPKSFDKQYLREYLESLDWDKTPPAPKLPQEVIENKGKYIEAYERITGRSLLHDSHYRL